MQLLNNAHTWQFSLETLKYVMEYHGFELVFGNENILSIFKKSSTTERNRSDVSNDEFYKALKFFKYLEKKYTLRSFIVRTLEIIGLRDIIKKLIGRK